jgi:hypothetical protein
VPDWACAGVPDLPIDGELDCWSAGWLDLSSAGSVDVLSGTRVLQGDMELGWMGVAESIKRAINVLNGIRDMTAAILA